MKEKKNFYLSVKNFTISGKTVERAGGLFLVALQLELVLPPDVLVLSGPGAGAKVAVRAGERSHACERFFSLKNCWNFKFLCPNLCECFGVPEERRSFRKTFRSPDDRSCSL